MNVPPQTMKARSSSALQPGSWGAGIPTCLLVSSLWRIPRTAKCTGKCSFSVPTSPLSSPTLPTVKHHRMLEDYESVQTFQEALQNEMLQKCPLMPENHFWSISFGMSMCVATSGSTFIHGFSYLVTSIIPAAKWLIISILHVVQNCSHFINKL